MSRKLLLLAIILSTLLLVGGLLIDRLPGRKKTSQSPSLPNTQNVTTKSDLVVALGVDPESVKTTAEDVEVAKDLSNVEKATLNITYNNNSTSPMTGIQVLLTITGEKFGLGQTSTATIIDKLPVSNLAQYVLQVPDAKPQSLNSAKLYIFTKKKGSIKIQAEVKTSDGKVSKTNIVTFTGN